jgi:hypothetical protein
MYPLTSVIIDQTTVGVDRISPTCGTQVPHLYQN